MNSNMKRQAIANHQNQHSYNNNNNSNSHASRNHQNPSPASSSSHPEKHPPQYATSHPVVREQLTPAPPSSNHHLFGNNRFSHDESAHLHWILPQKLGKDHLSTRPGPGGRKLTYIESCKAIELANAAFGFNGWSCHIMSSTEELRTQAKDLRWTVGYSSVVRITLKDGASHEDVGFGQSDRQKCVCTAIEHARKASISDARKRALRLFGEYLGNSCYDQSHLRDVKNNTFVATPARGGPANEHGVLENHVNQASTGRSFQCPPPVNTQPVPTSVAHHHSGVAHHPTTPQTAQVLHFETPGGTHPANPPPVGNRMKQEPNVVIVGKENHQMTTTATLAHHVHSKDMLEDLSLSQFDYQPSQPTSSKKPRAYY